MNEATNEATNGDVPNLGQGVFVRLRPEVEAVVRSIAADEERPLATVLRRLVEASPAVVRRMRKT